MLYTTITDSPFGTLYLSCDDHGLTEICLPGSDSCNNKACRSNNIPAVLTLTAQQLQEYFEGKRFCFELPLSLHGTDFQQKVWNIIHRIPYGQTMSYGEIATKLGNPGKARAVGGAAHANPMPLIIPCHRVIGANGALTGFAGGIELKKRLLELEQKYLVTKHCK